MLKSIFFVADIEAYRGVRSEKGHLKFIGSSESSIEILVYRGTVRFVKWSPRDHGRFAYQNLMP